MKTGKKEKTTPNGEITKFIKKLSEEDIYLTAKLLRTRIDELQKQSQEDCTNQKCPKYSSNIFGKGGSAWQVPYYLTQGLIGACLYHALVLMWRILFKT